jgi:hypothetical protein
MCSGSSSDYEELLGSCASKCLLLQELSVREYRVHPVNVKRNNFGEYHHLHKKLRYYPTRFFGYLRTEIDNYDYVLNLASENMQKELKNWHANPIAQQE